MGGEEEKIGEKREFFFEEYFLETICKNLDKL